MSLLITTAEKCRRTRNQTSDKETISSGSTTIHYHQKSFCLTFHALDQAFDQGCLDSNCFLPEILYSFVQVIRVLHDDHTPLGHRCCHCLSMKPETTRGPIQSQTAEKLHTPNPQSDPAALQSKPWTAVRDSSPAAIRQPALAQWTPGSRPCGIQRQLQLVKTVAVPGFVFSCNDTTNKNKLWLKIISESAKATFADKLTYFRKGENSTLFGKKSRAKL